MATKIVTVFNHKGTETQITDDIKMTVWNDGEVHIEDRYADGTIVFYPEEFEKMIEFFQTIQGA